MPQPGQGHEATQVFSLPVLSRTQLLEEYLVLVCPSLAISTSACIWAVHSVEGINRQKGETKLLLKLCGRDAMGHECLKADEDRSASCALS